MLEVGGYPSSINKTNVKTCYTFVDGKKKYFWKNRTEYDDYWTESIYSRIVYAFMLNNSTNNTLRVVYLDDSDNIKTKDFTLPNVTGYTYNSCGYTVYQNSLIFNVSYIDKNRTVQVISDLWGPYDYNPRVYKAFYINDIISSTTAYDINVDDGILGVDGNAKGITCEITKYGIWVKTSKMLTQLASGKPATYEENSYFIPKPNKNININSSYDGYKKSKWAPSKSLLASSYSYRTNAGRIMVCQHPNDYATYILRDTPDGEMLVKTFNDFPLSRVESGQYKNKLYGWVNEDNDIVYSTSAKVDVGCYVITQLKGDSYGIYKIENNQIYLSDSVKTKPYSRATQYDKTETADITPFTATSCMGTFIQGCKGYHIYGRTLYIKNFVTGETNFMFFPRATNFLGHGLGIMPLNSIPMWNSDNTQRLGTLQVTSENDIYYRLSSMYNYYTGKIFDKNTQQLYNIIRINLEQRVYTSINDYTVIQNRPDGTMIESGIVWNQCVIYCSTSYISGSGTNKYVEVYVSKDFGKNWTNCGNSLMQE